ncbi:hypothetical protein B0A50_05634 [Salinomyces thailandicus]|uniref:Uncharacterized protein n=1 Tax=Salinomyces thailandicus TaxID=706561 RepID=A0A4V5N414_9PEZI|nr:hypothetical protein B0A50_05634 [Salinomyces thailandica]
MAGSMACASPSAPNTAVAGPPVSPPFVLRQITQTVTTAAAEDKSARFPRFLDLPPELRNRIYHFALAPDPSTALVRPAPPALSATSRQVRQETLPIFYGDNCFVLQFTAARYLQVFELPESLSAEALRCQATARWLAGVERMGVGKFLTRVMFVAGRRCADEMFGCTEVVAKRGGAGFEVEDRGLWERMDGVAGLVRVGERKAVLDEWVVPHDLVDVLGEVVREGKGLTVSVVRKLVACFLEGAKCVVKR